MGNSKSSSLSTQKTSTARTEVINGSYEFKVTNYSLFKDTKTMQCVTSHNFTIGGHGWAIKFYQNLRFHTTNEKSISIYLVLPNLNDEARAMFDFSLLDQTGTPSMGTRKRLIRPQNFNASSFGWGFPNFMRKTEFDRSEFIKDDCFTIKCNISVIIGEYKADEDTNCSIEVPPSDLQTRLGNLLNSGENFDVSFEVEGEIINAHKCILFTRSQVFRAEILGNMNHQNNKEIIKIDDMKASVFRALLYFIYTDKLPNIPENIRDEELVIMREQLLVTANRYGLKKLKFLLAKKKTIMSKISRDSENSNF